MSILQLVETFVGGGRILFEMQFTECNEISYITTMCRTI
jgi:hypothetical protein